MTDFTLTPCGFSDAFADLEKLNVPVAKITLSSNLLSKMQSSGEFKEIWDHADLTLSTLLGHNKAGTIWGAELFVDLTLDINAMVLHSIPEHARTLEFICVSPDKGKTMS